MTMKKKGEEVVVVGTRGECGMCGREERWLLHNISSNGGGYKRVCTNCVLKQHPASFCPICFHVYDAPNAASFVTCLKCSSLAHSACAPPSPSFLCPSCASPSPAPFFPPSLRSLDKLSARALVAASTIAASSMSRAALAARAQADKSIQEAVEAKKRARAALENFLLAKAKADAADHNNNNSGASDTKHPLPSDN